MTTFRTLIAIPLVLGLFTTGCIMDADEVTIAPVPRAGQDGTGIGNGYNGNGAAFWDSISDFLALAPQGLEGQVHDDHVHIVATPLSNTPEGRLTLRETVWAALPEKVEVHLEPVDPNEIPDVAVGGLGMAPEWRSNALTNPQNQELITGYMLAMQNQYGVSVPLHFYWNNDPANQHQIGPNEAPDATFYGNLFLYDAETGRPGPAYGCSESDNPRAAFLLQERTCDESALCTFKVNGGCNDPLPAAACELSFPWWKCYDDLTPKARLWENPVAVTVPF